MIKIIMKRRKKERKKGADEEEEGGGEGDVKNMQEEGNEKLKKSDQLLICHGINLLRTYGRDPRKNRGFAEY